VNVETRYSVVYTVVCAEYDCATLKLLDAKAKTNSGRGWTMANSRAGATGD
jgi:hypothetical protein